MNNPRSPVPLRGALCALLMAAALAACGGGGGGDNAAPATTASELTVGATTTTVTAGAAAVTLTAGLNGPGTVSWTLAAGSAGTLSATTGASVNYLPPAAGSVGAATTVTITATSGSLSKNIVLQLAPGPLSAGLSLLAGNISSQFVLDGAGAAARFASISSLQADQQGGFYVFDDGPADTVFDGAYRHRLRHVGADGQVATLSMPEGSVIPYVVAMASDAAGNLYLLDSQPSDAGTVYRVRKRGGDGGVSVLFTATVANDAAAPTALAANAAGQVYVAYRTRVTRLTDGGGQVALAGSAGAPGDADGPGGTARFTNVTRMTAGADGALAVIDEDVGVRRIAADGTVSTLARTASGGNGDGDTTSARLYHPRSLVAGADGAVTVIDVDGDNYANFRTIRGGVLTTLFRTPGPRNCRDVSLADQLLSMAPDGGLVVATETTVDRLGPTGQRNVIAGLQDDSVATVDGQGAAARFCRPGLIDGNGDGKLYSLEGSATSPAIPVVLRSISPSGVVTTVARASAGVTAARGLVVAPDGRVLVALSSSAGAAIYQLQGDKFKLLAGLPSPDDPQQAPDSSGAAARFDLPNLSGVDSEGNLYVADHIVGHGSSVFRNYKITPQGVVTTTTLNAFTPAPVRDDAGRAYSVTYAADDNPISTVRRDDGTIVAGVAGTTGNLPGALPGLLDHPRQPVKLGPYSFALVSGSAIVRLDVPH